MCISPNLLSDGTNVRCQKCWQCKEHRVDNWVGRCIAESRVAAESAFITLTYGRDEHGNESHVRSSVLTYSDVQKYIKTLRKRGLRFRYLVCGEIGSKKGRTHWHLLVFFEDPLPAGFMDYGRNSWHREKRETPVFVPLRWHVRYNEPLWPHGFSQWDKLTYGYEQGGVRYACKYINKDVDDERAQSKLAMSKLPPLGAVYFDKLAKKLVDEGVSPQDPYYKFPNQARRKNGEIVRFKLAGRSLELFIENYIRRWFGFPPYLYQGPPSIANGPWWPHSDMIEEYLDKVHRDEFGDSEATTLEQRVRPANRWPFEPPFGFTDRDIICKSLPHEPCGEGSPCVETDKGLLWYGPDKNGVNGWRKSAPKTVWRQPPRYQVSPLAKKAVELTAYQWAVLLQSNVQWITTFTLHRGSYRLAKLQPEEGPKLWLKSIA